ncbi:hypothetical protein FAM09_14015 [Niastella caeni]|uniref:Uncharacterized protein n=1 Tax=Niastella caeni TaxID=2569763 RepID=A0A4S8I1N0_9BACT|nr:type VI-B CRISPR-associated RNA-guided ribonuclease Cas13b [Niastella caeni]THU39612.1 hypothetical protein FAM09_14015 [Niastella caeni]
MEQPRHQERKYFTLETTPWYFGAWLNQARHNLSIVLNDLSIKLGSKDITDDASLKATKAVRILCDANARPDDVQKALEYYEKKMPFLFAMHYKFFKNEELEDEAEKINEMHGNNLSASPEGYAAILHQLIEVLNAARNHYSHYATTGELSVPEDFFYLLNDAFDVNVRMVKRRFGLEESDIDHLRRFIPNKDPNNKGRNGKKLKVIPNPAFRYRFNKKDSKTHFSEFGLAFFCCLFLKPGDVYLFLKKISGFKAGDTPAQKASLNAYCINNLQLPLERWESDNSMQAVFLDMCNELSKAPKELYDTLHPDKQQLFITSRAATEDEQEMDDMEEPEPETKMVRKHNRFTFFAQRYLDLTNAFPNLRFAVDLGNFHYSIYPKVIAGNRETRHLTKHLIGYGKLEDFDVKNRPPQYAEKYCTPEQHNQEMPPQYIPEIFPHYQVENNLVAISIGEKNACWPELQTESTGGQRSYPYKYIKSKEKRPDAYISTHELPALLFYELVQDKKSGQEIILQHMRKVRAFFSEIKAGMVQPVSNSLLPKPGTADIVEGKNRAYNDRYKALEELLKSRHLKAAWLPEKLLHYLLGIEQKGEQHTKEIAVQRLTDMITDAVEKIERMELREKSAVKPGKKAFRKVKVGKLADTLSADMMQMQPPVKNSEGQPLPSSKANTTAFRVLQSHLAFYGAHKDKLRDIFRACKLIGGINPHPFLHRIDVSGQTGIIEFYKAYFIEKVKYLNHCKKERRYACYHFLRLKNAAHDIPHLVEEYLNEHPETGHCAFNLPRGLFLQASLDYFKEHGSPVMQEYIKLHAGRINSVHLINYYFQHEHKDAAQDFYSWPRQYELFKTPFAKNGYNDHYTIAERTKRVPALKEIIKADETQLAQLKATARIDKEEIVAALRIYRQIREMNNYLVDRYQKKYPGMIDLHRARFSNHDDCRKVVAKARAIIDDHINNVEKRIRSYRCFLENEQYLRLVEVQDKLLFLCIKKMLANADNKLQLLHANETTVQNGDTFLLRNITAPNTPGNYKSMLNCKPVNGISITLPYYAVNERGGFKKQEGKKILLGEVEIFDRHLKIKNNGNFRKLLKDRRLNNLCFYFMPDNEGKISLERNVLENELHAYERQRLVVLEKVAELEKALYSKHEDQAVDLFYNNGRQEHKRYLAFYFAQYISGCQEVQAKLNAIRNGFLHNQYPLIAEAAFKIAPEVWAQQNAAYVPSATGSTKGYGLIEKIAAFAEEQYSIMIAKITGCVSPPLAGWLQQQG